ncbi:MAG: 3-oxoacyl-[acyl-carrier-protein] reductase [Dissulfurispiraceae bacterium]
MEDKGQFREQKVALVTGGSRGIGRAIVEAFANDGFAVVINYNKSREEAETLRSSLLIETDTVFIEQADVADLSQARHMMDNVVSTHGRIDVLVNNAGITRDSFLMLMSEEDWRDVISTNLTGVFNCSKAATEHMISERRGVIINVSSLSGITGLPGQTNYGAAKGGVISFTKALSKELGPFGIRVNAVAPGVIETDMIGSLSERTKDAYLSAIPLKRFGKPHEVAAVVRFLASEDASYITGETICVTGGLY